MVGGATSLLTSCSSVFHLTPFGFSSLTPVFHLWEEEVSVLGVLGRRRRRSLHFFLRSLHSY
jgi:hypothetical protein